MKPVVQPPEGDPGSESVITGKDPEPRRTNGSQLSGQASTLVAAEEAALMEDRAKVRAEDREHDLATARRFTQLTTAITNQAQSATRKRVLPALVAFIGFALVVFWSVAGLIPDGRAWPTAPETVGGLAVGGLVLIGGAALALLSDYLPARAIAAAAKELNEADQARARSRNQRLSTDGSHEMSGLE